MRPGLPRRKRIRLKGYDYNSPGVYFLTICTAYMECALCEIIEEMGVDNRPKVVLSDYGEIVDEQIRIMDAMYPNLSIDTYVVMPNHVHILLRVMWSKHPTVRDEDGKIISPTPANTEVARFLSTFKRYVNKKIGGNIWHTSAHDRIVRNQREYDEIVKYIYANPIRWRLDRYNPNCTSPKKWYIVK